MDMHATIEVYCILHTRKSQEHLEANSRQGGLEAAIILSVTILDL
jgi:hypothetical protein